MCGGRGGDERVCDERGCVRMRWGVMREGV